MAPVTSTKSWKRQNRISLIFKYVVLIVIFLIIVIPIVMLIFGALKTRGELATKPYTIPIPPHFENITKILKQPDFWTMLEKQFFCDVGLNSRNCLYFSYGSFCFFPVEI